MKYDLIDKIDSKFQILYDNLEYSDYLDFINSDDRIKRYDKIISRVSIGYYPSFFIVFMSKDFLLNVDKLLKCAIIGSWKKMK